MRDEIRRPGVAEIFRKTPYVFDPEQDGRFDAKRAIETGGIALGSKILSAQPDGAAEKLCHANL